MALIDKFTSTETQTRNRMAATFQERMTDNWSVALSAQDADEVRTPNAGMSQPTRSNPDGGFKSVICIGVLSPWVSGEFS